MISCPYWYFCYHDYYYYLGDFGRFDGDYGVGNKISPATPWYHDWNFYHLLKTLAPIPSLTGCLQSSLFIWMPIQLLDVFVPWYPHVQWPCSLSPATPLMHLPTRLWWGDLALEYLLICIMHLSPCHSLCSCLEHLSVLLSHVASQLKAILERTHTFSPPETVSPPKPDPSYLPSFCLLIH